MDITLTSVVYTLVVGSVFVWGSFFATRAHSRTDMALRFGLFGAVLSCVSFSVIYTVFPLRDAPLLLSIGGVLLFHVTIIAITAGAYACVGWLLSYLRETHELFLASMFALFLTGAEYVRALLIPYLFSGEGTLLGAHFSGWSYGIVLALTPFVEFAYVGGIYALCFVFALCVGMYIYTRSLSYMAVGVTGLSVLLLVVHLYAPTYGPTQAISYTLIGTSGGESSHAFITKTLQEKNLGDLVIAPEDTRFLENITEEAMVSLLGSTLFLDGMSIKQGEQIYNTSLLYDPRKNAVTYREKGYLFPFGEYVPSFFVKLFDNDTVQTYRDTHTYTAGKLPVVFSSSLGTIGVLLCSELYSHDSVQALKQQHPHLVVVQSSLGWFYERSWALSTYELHLRVLAATLRTPVLVSSHAAPIYELDAYGNISHREDISPSTLQGVVDKNK